MKHAAEMWLLASPLPRLLRQGPADGLVLAYHNVVPRGEQAVGDRALHLPQDEFARQMDQLADTHDVVPLPELFSGPPSTDRPRAAVTFDDGYRGALTAGVEELAALGMPATFFVVPGLAAGHGYWWDELVPPGECAVPPAFRSAALARHGGREVEVRLHAGALRARPLPWHATVAGPEEMRAAAAVPGITLGSHGWTHAALPALDDAALAVELSRSLDRLRSSFAAAIPWLSYPYGLSTPRVEAAAARAGYEGAVRVGGVPGPSPQPMAVPRFNVPFGLSAAGFALRAGVPAPR